MSRACIHCTHLPFKIATPELSRLFDHNRLWLRSVVFQTYIQILVDNIIHIDIYLSFLYSISTFLSSLKGNVVSKCLYREMKRQRFITDNVLVIVGIGA